MRHTAVAASLSWIPSHALASVASRSVLGLGIAHHDEPLPDRLDGPDHIDRLRRDDRFRFGNVLELWADVEHDRITAAGVDARSGVVMGATTMRLGALSVTFPAVALPVLRDEPEVGGKSVVVRQTAGGRTGVPIPRPVPHPPFVQWFAPLVWTTLELALDADGAADVRLVGASAFPRHWVFGPDGGLVAKSGLAVERRWLDESFGARTPWGASDAPAVVSGLESALERRLSRLLMTGATPVVRHLDAGEALTVQGEDGGELFLLLDGVLAVQVDGEPIAEVGPGAVLGERAILENGRRTATLTAVTPARVAVAGSEAIDREALTELAAGHRREDAAAD